MSSREQYRINAEACLRMAKGAQDQRDIPLWVALAQSWLRLAEHVDRVSTEFRSYRDVGAEADEPVPN
jgi:ribosomal protein L39E